MALKMYRKLVPETAVECSRVLSLRASSVTSSRCFPLPVNVFCLVAQHCRLPAPCVFHLLSGIPLIGTELLYLGINLTAVSDRAGEGGCGMGMKRRFRLVLYLTWFAGACPILNLGCCGLSSNMNF